MKATIFIETTSVILGRVGLPLENIEDISSVVQTFLDMLPSELAEWQILTIKLTR